MNAIIHFIILILLMGCTEAQIDTEQLYRTWQRTGSTTDGQIDTGYYDRQELIVEFRPDGKLLYGRDKSEGGCCRYGQFTKNERTLQFTYSPGLTGCELVRCAAPFFFSDNKPWTITVLQDDRLVITSGSRMITFRAT